MKEFDYYIFIDYSVDIIGYSIIEKKKLFELIPYISKFTHYKDVKNKSSYTRAIKRIIEKSKVLEYFNKYKIRKMRENMEIYMDVFEFVKNHNNCIIFISIDDHEYSNFQKFVHIIEGSKTIVKPESKLIKGTPEYRASLVLDTLLNLERLKNVRNKN
jgi:hypothetical protein